MSYFHRLDTLRFFAFLIVFISHLFTKFDYDTLTESPFLLNFLKSFLDNGGAGVQIFFVLSGFLITFLLCKEEEKFGRINIRFFYMRRILRIWPLYYLVLILGIFILPHVANTFAFDGVIWKNLVFLNNFEMLKSGQEINTGVAWSVAIEEQFYVVWPILFVVFYRRNRLIYVAIITYLLSCWYTFVSPSTAYFHTFGNINYLMAGCMGGVLFFKQKTFISSKFKSCKLFYLNLFIILLLNNLPNLPVFLILPFNYLFIILYLVSRNLSVERNIFMKLGKYTYGMYLYHSIFLICTKIVMTKLNFDYENNILLLITVGVIALTLTITFSIVSYRVFESKFLKLKGLFTPQENKPRTGYNEI